MSNARDTDETAAFTLLFDTELMRPGCVLLQAVSGDTAALNEFFPDASELWLTHPTPGMRRLSGTREQWKRVATMAIERAKQERKAKRGGKKR